MSDTTTQSEAWQRDVAKRNAALQDTSRKLVDERRRHAELRDELGALARTWRRLADDETDPDMATAATTLERCADDLAQTLAPQGDPG